VKLLPRNKLIKTSPVDFADWNYRPALRTIQRLRYSLALNLLPERSGRLLEIGFGSGIFMPALHDRADRLYGIDVHDKVGHVRKILQSEGVRAELLTAAAEALPFETGAFDSIVVISTLEFLSDVDASCSEMHRVLNSAGTCVIITPGQSPVLDAGLKLLTGNSASKDFGDRRQRIIPALRSHFRVDHHLMVGVYHGFRLKRAAAASASSAF
jgi:ubiquinone/menaquinone biosynthesis C-methylase UbiE